MGHRDLERAVAEAFARRLTRRSVLLDLLAHHPRRPGSSSLRAMLGASRPALTRSEAEERFLALIRRAQLPTPEVNVMVCGFEVDFYWRAEQFVVEIDGFASHVTARMFESDRRRDGILAAAGVHVVRVTWHQIVNEPDALLVRLAQALARTSAPAP